VKLVGPKYPPLGSPSPSRSRCCRASLPAAGAASANVPGDFATRVSVTPDADRSNCLDTSLQWCANQSRCVERAGCNRGRGPVVRVQRRGCAVDTNASLSPSAAPKASPLTVTGIASQSRLSPVSSPPIALWWTCSRSPDRARGRSKSRRPCRPVYAALITCRPEPTSVGELQCHWSAPRLNVRSVNRQADRPGRRGSHAAACRRYLERNGVACTLSGCQRRRGHRVLDAVSGTKIRPRRHQVEQVDRTQPARLVIACRRCVLGRARPAARNCFQPCTSLFPVVMSWNAVAYVARSKPALLQRRAG